MTPEKTRFIIESVAPDGTATATAQTFAGVSVGEKVRIAGMGGTWTVKRIESNGVVCECECSRQHTQKFAFTRIRRPSEDGR